MPFPLSLSPRFVLLHTIAHAVIRQLTLECGYSTASLRERLYVSVEQPEMSGVLIYTSTPDSDGTLGGLERQGLPQRFELVFLKAVRSLEWCSSDPLCIEAVIGGLDTFSLAACHACCLMPETSCEHYNRYLDRATIVGAPDAPELGFSGFCYRENLMARMWPRQIPPDVLQNPRRSTEVDVYRRLAGRLDDSWWVFYSRPWLGLTATGAEKDGECDFVVANPKLGVLCLEVKGGAVAWNPETGLWTSRDRDGITHNIKDPVEQARSSKHELLKKLKQVPSLRNRWITARHGVVLPGSVNPGRDLGLDRPLRIFCFSDAYERLFKEWLVGRLRDKEGDNAREELGQDGLEALRLLLARPFQLKLSLGPLVRAEDREIAFLTQQQFHLLEAIQRSATRLIHGGAGTGKTVLATHLAQTLAESGLETLLVCYNRPLADQLATVTAGTNRLTIQSFHQLCTAVIGQAGRELPAETAGTVRLFQ